MYTVSKLDKQLPHQPMSTEARCAASRKQYVRKGHVQMFVHYLKTTHVTHKCRFFFKRKLKSNMQL